MITYHKKCFSQFVCAIHLVVSIQDNGTGHTIQDSGTGQIIQDNGMVQTIQGNDIVQTI